MADAIRQIGVSEVTYYWWRQEFGGLKIEQVKRTEFLAKAVQEWIAVVSAKTAYIERGSPWENGYIESFNARLRDELLDGEIFYTLREAQIVIESWRRQYETDTRRFWGYCPESFALLIWLSGTRLWLTW
jgi:transposase InsO family protein